MNDFPIAYLNSNDGTGILAFGLGETYSYTRSVGLNGLQDFVDRNKGSYLFGYLGYDLKNEIFNLNSNLEDHLNFPEAFFWKPKYAIRLSHESFEVLQGTKDEECFDFLNMFLEEETDQNFHHLNLNFKSRITKKEYLEKVERLKKHIQQGDIYEVNFCHEYYAEDVSLEYVLDAYFKLNKITKAPFSSYLQFDDFSVFCGSPERFIKKTGNKIITQPIKGTAPRGDSEEEDKKFKEQLECSPKDRAENVMIVDLVRNDFSKIAKKGSVQVEELCGLYTFETVHQLVSTVACEIEEGKSFTDIIKATFPMGSMTGAPKLSAMQLIEEHESFKRGLYSGSIGYIDPNGDFDFNVVIRTLLYNKNKEYLSCAVGSAITIQSDPEEEYNECVIKIAKILHGMNA